LKKILLYIFLFIHSFCNGQSNDTIDVLFRNSYRVFELMRADNGMYRDSKIFSGEDYHPVSIACCGSGLVSLCIADAMGWETKAGEKALKTIKTLLDHDTDYKNDRNENGFYRHFTNINTGENVWNSEYSTIDTGFLICGALFCKKYFNDDSLDIYVDELLSSVDFNAAIADSEKGKIYMVMNVEGKGDTSNITSVYNEYMIVAWLAKNTNLSSDAPGNLIWRNFYESPDSLPNSDYSGISVLTDNPPNFLPSFVHQFNYYLCHHFHYSEKYLQHFRNTMNADKLWWLNNTDSEAFEWGLGAGSTSEGGYHADKINDNPHHIVSPHIIAGYLPVNPDAKNDLLNMFKINKGLYNLPGSINDKVLWRYSLTEPGWAATEIQGIDYSTMLFGLASLPEYLGKNFFQDNNDFFEISTHRDQIQNSEGNLQNLYPNPTNNQVHLELLNNSDFVIKVYNSTGRMIKIPVKTSNDKISVEFNNFPKGIYYLNILTKHDSHISNYKIVYQ